MPPPPPTAQNTSLFYIWCRHEASERIAKLGGLTKREILPVVHTAGHLGLLRPGGGSALGGSARLPASRASTTPAVPASPAAALSSAVALKALKAATATASTTCSSGSNTVGSVRFRGRRSSGPSPYWQPYLCCSPNPHQMTRMTSCPEHFLTVLWFLLSCVEQSSGGRLDEMCSLHSNARHCLLRRLVSIHCAATLVRQAGVG